MLIVSKFHDYYDTASAYGIDKECVYNRDLKEIPIKVDMPSSAEKTTHGFKLSLYPVLIGFCGNVFPAVRLKYSSTANVYPLRVSLPKDEVIFNLNVYVERLKELGIELDNRKLFFWGRGNIDHRKNVEDFFNGQYENLTRLFREHHAPIFAIEKQERSYDLKVVINPKLNSYQFVRVKDPQTTFQDIYQYMAGVLGNKEAEIIQISDKDMLKQKGFDKYSFKTMKGDKKPRAKNRGKNE